MMDNKKIAEFIKKKRKEKKMTQSELSEKLYVTEKAISRWETGRGTPDVSLLLPLSEILNVSVSDILNGEEKNVKQEDVKDIIKYIEINRKGKFNFPLLLSILCYVFSIFIFLFYLKLDYTNYSHWLLSSYDYLIRLLLVIISSVLILLGNYIFSNNYVDKISDKKKVKNLSNIIIFIYYCILLFNLGIFARKVYVDRINLVPFKTIIEMVLHNDGDIFLVNIIGNIVIFIPIEYFLMELFKVEKFSKNIILAFFINLFFEVIQLIFKVGVFDIDDIILSLLGMMAFYFFYNKFKLLKNKNLWIVFITISIIIAFLGYNLISRIYINYDYDDDRMNCVVLNDAVMFNLFGTNLVKTNYIYRKVDNQVFIFINGKIKISYLLQEKQQYKDSLNYKDEKNNNSLYGVKLQIDFDDKLVFDNGDIVEVLYTNISFDQIEKATYEKIFEIRNRSFYMCSNKKAKS